MAAVPSYRPRAFGALILVVAAALASGRALGETGASPPAAAPGDAASAASPVSATGLLPIFGVAIDFDALPNNAKPDDAVAAVQKLWDGRLKAAGFNVVQFSMEARELGDKGAARLAKLCAWAKTNNVRLAPTLLGAAPGERIPADYPDKVGAFAARTIELVSKSDPAAYAQIMFYQLERPLNHPGNHGAMEPPQAAELLASAVAKLHAAEQGALAGSSLQATPVLAGVSFDYELIRFGAIANASISDESYQQAYASMHDYLAAVLGAAPVDVVGLEWFPGSLSADGVDRFPDVIGKLQADFPGKLIVVSTGYSTAAGGEADQSRYYTQTFNNLSDLRTNQGVESSFAGILWRTASDRAAGEPSPPSSKTLDEMKSWNWTDRAAELTRMWNEPGSDSKEMRWWLGRVESRFGLMGASKDASKPGVPKAACELLAHLKTSLVAAAEATGAGAIAQELTSAASGSGGVKGLAGAVKEKLQAALFGMLDAWVAKTAENLVSGGGDNGGGGGSSSGGGAPPPPPAPPSKAELYIDTPTIEGDLKVGTPVSVSATLMNGGAATATAVMLYLKENNGSHDLTSVSAAPIAPGGSQVVTIPWTPDHPGSYPKVTIVAYCDNDGQLTDNSAGPIDLDVANTGGGGSGGGGSGGKGGGKLGGFGDIRLDSKVLGGVKGHLVTKTDPGFIQIEAVRGITPVPMMYTMSGAGPGGGGAPGGGTVRMGGTGAGAAGRAGAIGTAGAGSGGTQTMSYKMEAAPVGPQPISLAFTVTNPFDHMFTGVKGTLKVDNKVIATKDLGVLFPRQRRTVSFAQWTPPKPGTFPVRIELAGMGPGARPLTATAMDQLTVSPSGTAGSPSGAATRTVIGGQGAAGSTPPPPTPIAMAGRGGTGFSQTRLLMPLIAAPAPATGPGPATRSLYLVPGGKRPVPAAFASSILGLTANSILLAPFPAPVGSDVAVTIRLFNSDRLPANRTKVEVYVDGDKLGETTLDVPVARAVVASGFGSWKAKPGRHDVRAVVTAGSRSGMATKPIDVRPPHAVGAGGVAMLIGRGSFSFTRLAMTAADVRLNPPAPAAGSPVDVSVRVQNPGGAEVKGVRVELFADGTRLGEVSGTIAAGKDFVFSGFPKWTPASGQHKLLLRASAAGSITEATRDVAVGAGLVLVKPLLTNTTIIAAPSTGTSPKVDLRSPAVTGMTLMIATPDLQILPGDITFLPVSPKAGDPLTINITVRNIGNAVANGGTVRAILQVDGAESTRREFPVTIAASGMATLSWPVTTPSGKTLTAVGTAIIANDSRADNNQAQASTSVAVLKILTTPRVTDFSIIK